MGKLALVMAMRITSFLSWCVHHQCSILKEKVQQEYVICAQFFYERFAGQTVLFSSCKKFSENWPNTGKRLGAVPLPSTERMQAEMDALTARLAVFSQSHSAYDCCCRKNRVP